MTTMDAGAPAAAERPAAGRLLIGGVGAALILLGIVLTLINAPSLPELISTGVWLLVPALASDLVLMPVAAVLSVLVTRHLPAAWRTAVCVALSLSAFVVLIGWPFMTGFGRKADNASLLNRNYVGGALVLIAVIWVVCLVVGLVRWLRARSAGRALADDQLG